jgi:hypothetical protein
MKQQLFVRKKVTMGENNTQFRGLILMVATTDLRQ